MNKTPKVTLGIISYKDIPYLEISLPLLLKQNYSNYEIIICDNNPDQKTTHWIKRNFPEIKVINKDGNIGFSKGHNKIINQAIKSKSDYYIAYNSDIFPSPDLIQNLSKSIHQSKNTAIVSPKLLQWRNFPNDPTKQDQQFIDTTGLVANLNHTFQERGFNQLDKQQFDQKTNIWGASGACPIFDLKLIQEIQYNQQTFDENFFMYKEDIDLSYRIRWNGYKVKFCPQAVAWHNRTGKDPGNLFKQIQERRKRPKYIVTNSFLNHLQLFYKNYDKNFTISTKLKIYTSLSKYFLYVLIFSPSTLLQLKKFFKLIPDIKKRKQNIKKAISTQDMESLIKTLK